MHLVCVPRTAESLARVFNPVNLRYAQHVNWTRHLSGRLWQGRFFSCALDDSHLWAAIRYVERNPVRAGLVSVAGDYPWSSAAAHCGLRRDPVLSPLPPGGQPTGTWAAWLAEDDDPNMLAALRLSTRTGRPNGDRRFIARLESVLGRALLAKLRGRPRMPKSKGQKNG